MIFKGEKSVNLSGVVGSSGSDVRSLVELLDPRSDGWIKRQQRAEGPHHRRPRQLKEIKVAGR